MKAFMKLMRSEATESLMKKPAAFLLMSVIAYRVKRTDDFNIDGLKIGEAFIGDYRNFNLTEAAYRNAKEQLVKHGLISTRATNKGTVATILNSEIYDLNILPDNKQNDTPTTGKQRVSSEQDNGQTTTNKNKELKNKEYLPPNPQGGTDINLGIDPSPLPIEIQNQEGMGGGEIHPLRKWIAKDLPNVSKMKTQLTNQNCEDLIEEFGKKLIQNVLEAMENVNGIQKKYTSVNLTVRNWAKKRVEDHPELKPKPQPVEMPNWFPQADE
jgi:hypothetical protein